jgi:pyrroloquinoline quinone (PQQ) biosynthesis protein C
LVHPLPEWFRRKVTLSSFRGATMVVKHLRSRVLRKKSERAVDEGIERIQAHPFIKGAEKGRLNRNVAERWILCAGRESRSFPKIIETMIAHCDSERVKQILSDNLDDEHGNGNPEQAHFKHYLQLIEQLGIGRERFSSYDERAGIKLALGLAESVSRSGDLATGIGYMLMNEGMTSVIYKAMQTALQGHFPTMVTPFFDMHIEVDDKHVEDLYAAVEELDEGQIDALLFGIQIGERGMAVLLDEAYGVFDSYREQPENEYAA